MRAMLMPSVPVLTRPMNSSITLGLFPAAAMRVGAVTCVIMTVAPLGGITV
jgi:hypothetical protein